MQSEDNSSIWSFNNFRLNHTLRQWKERIENNHYNSYNWERSNDDETFFLLPEAWWGENGKFQATTERETAEAFAFPRNFTLIEVATL